MNFASWIFENYLEKFSFPWGFNESVDSFTGFMYFKNMFIKGKFYLYGLTSDKNKNQFDYIQFMDDMPVSQREVINEHFKFFLSLVDFREISFFDSMMFVRDKNFPPIDPNSLNHNIYSQFNVEDISGENLIFCRILTRVPLEKEDISLRSYALNYNIEENAIFSTYVLGLSYQRTILMKNAFEHLCPFVKFNSLSKNSITSELTKPAIIENVIIDTVCNKSSIFNNEMISDLFQYFPSKSQVDEISLVFNTMVDGCSLNSLYRLARDSASSKFMSPIFMLAIKDFNSTVFGAVLADVPSPSHCHLGNGETFVFTFKNGKLEVYKWSGKNEYFQLGTPTSFSVGCDQGKFAIWIDDRLFKGRSEDCKTFDCPQLTKNGDFECKIVELWAFSLY